MKNRLTIEYIGGWIWIPKRWNSDDVVINWGWWVFRWVKREEK